jgi:hypothetical protein
LVVLLWYLATAPSATSKNPLNKISIVAIINACLLKEYAAINAIIGEIAVNIFGLIIFIIWIY